MSNPYTVPPDLFGSLEEDYQQQFITSEEGLIGSSSAPGEGQRSLALHEQP